MTFKWHWRYDLQSLMCKMCKIGLNSLFELLITCSHKYAKMHALQGHLHSICVARMQSAYFQNLHMQMLHPVLIYKSSHWEG